MENSLTLHWAGQYTRREASNNEKLYGVEKSWTPIEGCAKSRIIARRPVAFHLFFVCFQRRAGARRVEWSVRRL